MKLSVSNIAWTAEQDNEMYAFLQKHGFAGIEIAPTRIFSEAPYDRLEEAARYAAGLMEQYGLSIPSIQSIWYGRQENLFTSSQERNALYEYTKKAIDFAEAVLSHNLVFGCPRNRAYTDQTKLAEAIHFFHGLGEYALTHHTVLSMEANPPIYNTNYCNTTKEALELTRQVGSEGFMLNLDVGTMIQNREDMEILEGHEKYINHVHVSEPYLNAVEKRSIHGELAAFLREHDYTGYVSLEVKTQEETEALKDMLWYILEVFA